MANFEARLLEAEALNQNSVWYHPLVCFFEHFQFFKFCQLFLPKKPYGFENHDDLHLQKRTVAFGAQKRVQNGKNRNFPKKSENSSHFLSNAVSIAKIDQKFNFLQQVKVGPYLGPYF